MKILFSILLLALLTACGKQNPPTANQAREEVKTNEAPKAQLVQLSAQQVALAEIKTGPLPQRPWKNDWQVNGEVVVLPQAKAVVHAPAQAYLSSIRVKEGDAVRKGERLAWLEHPEFIRLQQELLESKARLPYLQKEQQRQAALAQSEAGPQQKAESTAADYQVEKARYEGLKARLQWLGVDVEELEQTGQFQGRLALRATASGNITHQSAREGQLAQPQDALFEITQLKAPQVQLSVYAKDLARVQKGQQVEFHLLGQSQKYQARVTQIVPQMESEEQAARVWIQPSEKVELLPGMRLRARIQTDGELRHVLPKDAVLERNGRHFAFVQKAAGFGLVPITVLDENQEHFAVEAPAQEDFVLEGGYYLREQF